jgi:putative ABC transport system permease protein
VNGLLAVKLRRDIRVAWPRFVLMVLAMAVCLVAFGSVLFAWAASGRETKAAYSSTTPASATIVLDRPVSVDRMATITAGVALRPGVIEVAGRTMFTGDLTVGGRPSQIPLQAFAAPPEDDLKVARFFLRERAWSPAADEIYLGRDSLDLLGVAVGDTLTVESPSGKPLRLRIADTVYDPSLSPSPQEQTARGYLSTAALTASSRSAVLDQVKLLVAEPGRTTPSQDRDAIVATAGDVGAWMQREYGVAVREIQVPKPGAHPHQWQSDTLLLSLLAGGAAALLLSSILVANMLANLFTQQIPQIGIMKAVGARSGRIGRHYLALTLAVSSAATLLALGPAVVLGRLAASTFLGFLGIEEASLTAPWWTYLVLLAIGIGLPPLMAIAPLVKASRTTVRAAIDHHGGGSPARATGVLAWLGRLRGADRVVLLAVRNTVRRPTRSVLAVGLLACAGTVFVAGMSLSSQLRAITEEESQARTWDVDVQLAEPVPMGTVRGRTADLPGVAAVEGLTTTPTGVAVSGRLPVTRTYPDQGHGRISLTAVPEQSATFAVPPVSTGRWLRPGETGAVVISEATRKSAVPGVEPGDDVQLMLGGRATTWRVVGLVQQSGGGHGGLYTTADGLTDALGQAAEVNRLRVVTTSHDEDAREAVAAAVEQSLTGAGVAVLSADSVSRSEAISSGHFGPVILILLGVTLPLGVVGLIGLASTTSANVLERTREFGVMHAIGALPRTVRRIVVIEGMLLAITSVVVAMLPAWGLTALLGAGLGDLFFSAPLPFRFSLPAVAIWLLLVTLGAVLATESAASRASRMTVREALAYE